MAEPKILEDITSLKTNKLNKSENTWENLLTKPRPSDIGAANAFTISEGHWGITHNDGTVSNWVRTTLNGFIPYQSGGASSLGTSTWPFQNIFANNIYDNGVLLEDKFLKFFNMQGVTTDMNNLRTPGVYHIQLETTSNKPESAWGTCYVSYIAHSLWIQQLWVGQFGEIYVRTSYDAGNGSSPWNAWRRVAWLDSNNYLTTASRVYNAIWNDYAEYFEKENVDDQDFEPGDVIVSNNDKYTKSTYAYQESVIGVYSDSYGHIVGGTGDLEKDDKECIPIGLSGRVRVKVVGKVKNGQLLTSSDIPGVAMYASEYKPGTIIGKAVEDKDTEEIGKVKMFIMNI